jgi:hypothetical protein
MRVIRIVSDKDDGYAARPNSVDETKYGGRLSDTKGRGWLIEDQKTSPEMEGASDCESLSLTAGHRSDQLPAVLHTADA